MSLVGRLFFENQFAPAANAWAETRAHRQAERRRTAIQLQERTAEIVPARVYARDVELTSVTVKDGAAETLLGSDCVICLATFEPHDECNILPCAHTFHASCIKGWLDSNNTCPTCRTAVVDEDAEATGLARSGQATERPVTPSGVTVTTGRSPSCCRCGRNRLTKVLSSALAVGFTLGLWLLLWSTTGLRPDFRPSVDSRGVTHTSGDSVGSGSQEDEAAPAVQCAVFPPLEYRSCSRKAGCAWYSAGAICLPETLATTLSSLESSSSSATLNCQVASSADDCARMGEVVAQEYGISGEAGASSPMCEWAVTGADTSSNDGECRVDPELPYLIARQWCADRVEGVASICGEGTAGVCTMVDCPSNGDGLYTSRECVLEPSVVFASWCAGRSRLRSLCIEPTEAAETGGCGTGSADTQRSSHGRGVAACRWEEDFDLPPYADGVAATPRCSSNLDRWLASSGRR